MANDKAVKLDDLNVVKSYLNKKISEAKSEVAQVAEDYTDTKTKPITGDGAPTTETVGRIGEIYTDATTGTSYQCTAVADGVYTWVRIIKQTDTAKQAWGTNSLGLIAFYSNPSVTGISAHNEAGMVFPTLANPSDNDIKTRVVNKAITTKTLNNAVKATMTDDNKMELTDEEKKTACEVLGATKWYRHTIKRRWIGGLETDFNTLEVISLRATPYTAYDLTFNNCETIIAGQTSVVYKDYWRFIVGYTYGYTDSGYNSYLLVDEFGEKHDLYEMFGIIEDDELGFVDTVTAL